MFTSPTRSGSAGGGVDGRTLQALEAAKGSGKLAIRNCNLPYIPKEVWNFQELTFGKSKGKGWWEQEPIKRLHVENCGLLAFSPAPALRQIGGSALDYSCIKTALPVLQALHVIHNEGLREWPIAAFRLPTLQEIDLSFNAIESFATDETDTHLGDVCVDDVVAPLRTLSLHHNQLASLSDLRILMLLDSPLSSSLTRLQLQHNVLEGIPRQILNLAALTSLDLSHNRLTELPDAFGERLTLIRDLDVSHNKLTSWPASLASMAHLQRLNMRDNRITAVREVGGVTLPPTLVELFLGCNSMAKLVGFQNLPNLATLELSDNRLEELSPLAADMVSPLPLATCWPALKRLDIHNNNIGSLPRELGLLDGLAGLQVVGNPLSAAQLGMSSAELVASLKRKVQETPDVKATVGERHGGSADWAVSEGRLDLTGRAVGGVPIGMLTSSYNATHLMKLNLSKNKLTELPAEIGMLTGLQELDVSRNALEGLPTDLRQCLHLKDLNLSSNKLSCVPGSILSGMSSLKVLNLAANALGHSPVSLVCLLPAAESLLHLSLAGNKLKTEQVDFETICSLSSLKHLDLSSNALHQLPASLALVTSLAVLDVQYNEILMLPLELRQLTKPIDRRKSPLRILAYGNLRQEATLLKVPPS